MYGFGVKLVHKLITLGLLSANGAEEGDFSVVSFGYGSNSDRLVMNSHSDVERARL